MSGLEAGLCQCRCGQRTNLAPVTSRSKGWVKGEPLRFVAGHQTRTKRWRAPLQAENGKKTRELLGCMVGFGVEEARIAGLLGIENGRVQLRGKQVHASTARELARLHWGAWRASAEFRRDCRCPVPREVLESLKRAS
ncbi:MAG: hypothetical protein M3P49_09575 [Actinomycetota bacterium]|nr:hypothetical protein [Actinomycetota bacterium]